MKTENGGPAFPRPASEYTINGTLSDGDDAIEEQDGMTLRTYLAAKFAAAWLPICGAHGIPDKEMREKANMLGIAQADDMIDRLGL